MKIDFHTIGIKEKKEILKEASNQMSMPDYNVEKDWWVARTLGLVFKMKIGAHLVFKGGTSLSKSWGIIERFSEDVDLAVDRSFFDFEGVLQKKQITKLRKVASTYIVD